MSDEHLISYFYLPNGTDSWECIKAPHGFWWKRYQTLSKLTPTDLLNVCNDLTKALFRQQAIYKRIKLIYKEAEESIDLGQVNVDTYAKAMQMYYEVLVDFMWNLDIYGFLSSILNLIKDGADVLISTIPDELPNKYKGE